MQANFQMMKRQNLCQSCFFLGEQKVRFSLAGPHIREHLRHFSSRHVGLCDEAAKSLLSMPAELFLFGRTKIEVEHHTYTNMRTILRWNMFQTSHDPPHHCHRCWLTCLPRVRSSSTLVYPLCRRNATRPS